tara:strand:+ start:1763 stop:3538 length:1776 start_codon:yes stop_codon:yes gene_type:complete
VKRDTLTTQPKMSDVKTGYILGISAYYHDSAACLLYNGTIVAAIAEERLTRIKHDESLPIQAIELCLNQAGITIDEVDAVVFYEKTFIKFERILETFVKAAPFGFIPFQKALKSWLKEKLWIPSNIRKELNYKGKLYFTDHHESHAASACFTAPFTSGAYLVMDAVGEKATTSFGIFENGKLEVLGLQEFPNSIGMLYSAFTYYCGFKVNSGEYKLMGLAPYGEPKYVELIENYLVKIQDDGSIELNMRYFHFHRGLKMINAKFEALFGQKARKPESEITTFYKDVAASIQKVTEHIILKMVKHTHTVTGAKNLCLSGGVALNCVANQKIDELELFENIWIQPAAGDAGGALGAALAIHAHLGGQTPITWHPPYLGSSFREEQIIEATKRYDLKIIPLGQNELVSKTAELLANQKSLGWFQGCDEWGPRALGNRSILASPVHPEMQKRLNLQIKKREDFRPFAPVVLEEKAKDWFEINHPIPYMQFTVQCKQPEKIQACVHVDGSSRVQTINQQQNDKLHALLQEMDRLTGVPVLINTSFNQRGEPIVHTPEDAIRCFLSTEMDALVLGNVLIIKSEQDQLKQLEVNYALD